MRESDLLVLLGLLREGPDAAWSLRTLASSLSMPMAGVQRSLARLGETPAFDVTSRRVSWAAAEEVLLHAVPYIAPASIGGPTRGIPTAWAAEPLVSELAPSRELPPVWPAPEGRIRGLAVPPLHSAAIELAASDGVLYAALTLVDGLRIGDARVRGLARDHLAGIVAGWETS